MHYVEALLDEPSEEAVRRQWSALREAGLPSLADHRSASNRPHVTWTVVEQWPEDPDTTVVPGLPLRVALGPYAVLGGAQPALVRTLVVTEQLLAVRRAVVGRLDEPARPFYAADRWVPHLTLATRLDADQVAAALALLGAGGGPEEVTLVGSRRWDAEARETTPFP